MMNMNISNNVHRIKICYKKDEIYILLYEFYLNVVMIDVNSYSQLHGI